MDYPSCLQENLDSPAMNELFNQILRVSRMIHK